MKLFGSGFQTWKLHTASDYAVFFAYILFGVLIFAIIIKYMNRQRNHEKAVRRVAKKLKKLAKRPSRLYENVTFRFPDGDQSFDLVLADKSGIFLVRTYGWGIKIYGTPEGETWRRVDTQRKEEFPNPLIELKEGVRKLGDLLKENGVNGVRIMPMVVFADNFQTPELYLGYGSFSTTCQELKGWYRKQASVKEAQYDMERVFSILDAVRM